MTRWYWHIHHDKLVEPATEPIANRRAYIRISKPKHEVALRLRLLRRVPSAKLPMGLRKAWADYAKAWADSDKAGADYDKAGADSLKAGADYDKAWADYAKAGADSLKAGADYDKAWADCVPTIVTLHSQECPDCPWDGTTIFPDGSKT